MNDLTKCVVRCTRITRGMFSCGQSIVAPAVLWSLRSVGAAASERRRTVVCFAREITRSATSNLHGVGGVGGSKTVLRGRDQETRKKKKKQNTKRVKTLF